MERSVLQHIHEKMTLEYRALCKDPKRVDSSHFKHLAGNILQSMAWVSHGIRFDWNSQREQFLTNWQQLRTYFELITEFEEFKQGELSSKEGYFPLAPSQTHKEYICYAVQKLRNK